MLAAGEHLGHFEILALIGKGGMGEVYRARDTRLKRDVAIKVLPAAFAHDPDRMARFQREAEILASLNHPGIAQIHGVEQAGDIRALIMEYVDGQSPKGPLPFDEAWRIATQMAEALEYAHEKGIVHRDLKPANVRITPEGEVKLLDFGLAKAFQDPQTGEPRGQTDSTVTLGATTPGTVVGTASYMAPEQARGQKVDKRADVFGWAVVLWELLTGKRMFQGSSVQDTLAQVLTKQPDLELVPLKIRPLLAACLEKDPKNRLRDIGDRGRLLLTEGFPLPVPATHGWGLRVWFVATLLTLGLGLTAYALWPSATELKPLVRLNVDLGPEVALSSTNGADLILSPDGNRIAYVSQGRLYTRRLDQPQPIELPGTEGAYAPFFSPDGQWVGFFAQSKLKKISVGGGSPVTLCDAVFGRGATWGTDSYIIAALASAGGVLSRIPEDGGQPQPLTKLDPDRGENTHRWPQILPGGKAVLFTVNSDITRFDQATIEVLTLADRRRKFLHAGTYGRYLPTGSHTGHLVYVSGGTLFAVPFDPERLEVLGTPTPVLEKVAYDTGSGYASISFSQAGALVYRQGADSVAPVTVRWMDSAGKTQPLVDKPDNYEQLRLSPDGNRVALVLNGDIWVYEPRGPGPLRLTSDRASRYPVWTLDGRFIVYAGRGGMWWTHADGSSTPQALTQSKNVQFPWSFSPEGRLGFIEIDPVTGVDLWTVPVKNNGPALQAGQPEVFLKTQFAEWYTAFSPDGRWVAYSSNESGEFQVYVRAFPDKGGKWLVSNQSGLHPEWSRSTHELFFWTQASQVMVAGYSVRGDSFVPDKPRVWSEKRLPGSGLSRPYDLRPDGKHIVALMSEGPAGEPATSSHVTVLLNFFDELRRRVPR